MLNCNTHEEDTCLIEYDFEKDEDYCEECKEENERKGNDERRFYAAKINSEERKSTQMWPAAEQISR